jgi:hypothetical protein
MKRRFKGVREFAQRTTGWDVRSQLRFISESGRDIHSIISPDWCPIGPTEPIIPQCELTPWLTPPKISRLHPWDEDYWMTKPINSISVSRNLLKKIYNVLIKRSEIEFYRDYVPIRWYWGNRLAQDFNEILDKFKYETRSEIFAGNFAISEENIRPSIETRAKKFKIEIMHPKATRTIFWARRDMLLNCELGRELLNYWRCMEERALKFGIPSYPLHINLVFENLNKN